mmetsp:Transcript_21819/g.37446  ORF Transcript_21819/g.37446 Transcript_21819/m.37446 type:complete len:303 (+) Transcript_21819:196-1104(+)
MPGWWMVEQGRQGGIRIIQKRGTLFKKGGNDLWGPQIMGGKKRRDDPFKKAAWGVGDILHEGVEEELGVEERPDEAVKLLDRQLRRRVDFTRPADQHGGQQRVHADHEGTLERVLEHKGQHDGSGVVHEEEAHADVEHFPRAGANGEGHDVELAVAFNVRQVLRDGDDESEEGHEEREEDDGRVPRKRDAEGLGGGVVHAKVQQEAAACRDAERRHDWVLLPTERRNRVGDTQKCAQDKQPKNKRAEVQIDEGDAEDSGEDDQKPAQLRANLPGGHRKIRLVYLVDVHVENLIHPHNESVTT